MADNTETEVNEEVVQNFNQENLFSRVIKGEGKVYYLDVRENKRGLFLKFTEKRMSRRQTVVLSSQSVNTIKTLIERTQATSFDPSSLNEDEAENWSTVDTEKYISNYKRMYFDVMVNKHGRSLNIAEISEQKGKSAVIVSENCWTELLEAFSDICSEYPLFVASENQNSQNGNEENDEKLTTLWSKKVNLKSKVLFLDFMEDDSQIFLKLSEMRNKRKSSLNIPDVALTPIVEFLQQLENEVYDGEVEGMEDNKEVNESGEVKTLTQKILELQADDDEGNRIFHLDMRENNHGKFLRLTEYKTEGKRSGSIFLPQDSFAEVIEVIQEYMKSTEEE